MPIVRLSQMSGFQNLKPAASPAGFATNIVSGSQKRYRCAFFWSTRYAASNRSGNLAFGKILNQSLLDAFECFRRVVVPIARCFSSDSYGGSVMSRSADAGGKDRSQATASIEASWKRPGIVPPLAEEPWLGKFSAIERRSLCSANMPFLRSGSGESCPSNVTTRGHKVCEQSLPLLRTFGDCPPNVLPVGFRVTPAGIRAPQRHGGRIARGSWRQYSDSVERLAPALDERIEVEVVVKPVPHENADDALSDFRTEHDQGSLRGVGPVGEWLRQRPAQTFAIVHTPSDRAQLFVQSVDHLTHTASRCLSLGCRLPCVSPCVLAGAYGSHDGSVRRREIG